MMKKRRNEKIYALYHGEEFLDLGTKKEISERTGISIKTLSFYMSISYKKRRKFNYDNCYVMIAIEGEENDGEIN